MVLSRVIKKVLDFWARPRSCLWANLTLTRSGKEAFWGAAKNSCTSAMNNSGSSSGSPLNVGRYSSPRSTTVGTTLVTEVVLAGMASPQGPGAVGMSFVVVSSGRCTSTSFSTFADSIIWERARVTTPDTDIDLKNGGLRRLVGREPHVGRQSVTTGASGGQATTTVGTGDRCDVSYRSRLGDTDAVEKSCTYLLEGNQLGQLQQRNKWATSSAQKINIGSLVVLIEDNTPPLKWPLGRVVKLHPGKDGITRVVTIQTQGASTVKRAVRKLCVLPVDTSDSAAD
ncbi:hypothetical protein GEV33_004246 [Tenebrio molitor]|uniref:DUF5641 domain-containing protein n=1 Tax=Tenebrio molitor TaxID=7067 RepID=A0A8J6HR84_TENMO|nr:hypothetical protein GEV33_004246 [Tenebrio molitor]